ncbi:MAG: hypothetical protein ABFE13_19265, partial [Phycisphaerales bacterium]
CSIVVRFCSGGTVMGNRPGSRTRLYVLSSLLGVVLVASLVLLHLTRDRGGSTRSDLSTRVNYGVGLHTPPEGAARLIVPMEEIRLQEVREPARYSFLTGDNARVEPSGDPDVNYPAFQSPSPRFGEVRFAGAGVAASWRLHFALDHSEGTPGTYDLLYCDENNDLDLRNDPPRRVLTDPNGFPRTNRAEVQSIWFEPVTVPFPAEPEGRRLVELLPRLWLYKDGEPRLNVVAAKVHKGRFEIGGKTCEAFLGYGSTITGRLDLTLSALCVLCEDSEHAGLVGTAMEELGVMRSLGGRWCQFSCTPTGDQLFVYPYEGPLGVLRLDAGGRDAKRLEMFGELCTTRTRLCIGHMLENGLLQGADKYEIPVGDYYPDNLVVCFGDVRFSLSYNPYAKDSDGCYSRHDRATRSIRIREDQPFVLDFPDKPRVVFVHPRRKDRPTPGDEVRVEAVLVDPVLDAMVQRLEDMAQSETRTYTMLDGRQRTFETGLVLQPRVVVKRGGEILAEGVMPFG